MALREPNTNTLVHFSAILYEKAMLSDKIRSVMENAVNHDSEVCMFLFGIENCFHIIC